MKGNFTVYSHYLKNKTSANLEILKEYILIPVRGGLFGFALFFSLLLLLKIFSYVIGAQTDLIIDLTDVLISSIGFILLFLVRFLEKFQR